MMRAARLDGDASSVTAELIKLECSEDGIYVTATVRLSCGSKSERRAFLVRRDDFVELGLSRGEIGKTGFDLLESAAKLCEAQRRGEGMLGYGSNSVRRLTVKLRKRGYDAATAERAVARLVADGYIREEDDAEREARRSAASFHGPRYIAAQLSEKGYGHDTVEKALDALDDVDFAELCARFIEKKYKPFPTDRREYDKMIATLMRRGYPVPTVRAALQILRSEA